MSDELPHTDEYWLAMAALDQYPIDDRLPKSTSVVFRIHQLGHAWEATRRSAGVASDLPEATVEDMLNVEYDRQGRLRKVRPST